MREEHKKKPTHTAGFFHAALPVPLKEFPSPIEVESLSLEAREMDSISLQENAV